MPWIQGEFWRVPHNPLTKYTIKKNKKNHKKTKPYIKNVLLLDFKKYYMLPSARK